MTDITNLAGAVPDDVNNSWTLLEDLATLQARVAQLVTVFQRMLGDFGAQLVPGTPPLEVEEDYAAYDYLVSDGQETLAWLKIVGSTTSGRIGYLNILSGPRGDWDFMDLSLDQRSEDYVSYEDFQAQMADLPVTPPERDYGLDIVNILAFTVSAMQQLAAQESPDLDNLFEAGHYRLRLVLADAAGRAVTNYWLHASSSEDAKAQVREMAGARLAEEPVVIDFRREEPEY